MDEGLVIPHLDYAREWLQENSPLFRLWEAIEKERPWSVSGKREPSIKLNGRDWLKIARSIEMLLNLEEGFRER